MSEPNEIQLALHKFVNTDELASLTAGGTDFIRTKNGKVKGIAIRRDLNPEAPKIVLVGKGENRRKRAMQYLEQNVAVPAFVKRDINNWEYIGDYRAIDYSESLGVIKKYNTSTRIPGSVAGVLFLEAVTTQTVSIVGGGFPNSETRREIEEAAVSYVWAQLEARGYDVEDRQPENLGYDLLAKRRDHHLLIEVKGTDAREPRFFITRNEWNVGRKERDWRLFVVTMARKEPSLLEYTSLEVQENFNLEPLAWECTSK